MPSRALRYAVALIAFAGLGACHPKSLSEAKDDIVKGGVHVSTSEMLEHPVTVADRLTCPEQEGDLKRTAQAADGKACSYRSDKGEVELTLLPAAGADTAAALAPLKAKLDAMMPAQAKGGTINVVSEKGADGRDHAKVDMPFIHVNDDGKRSHVKIFGMTIDADNNDNNKPGKPLSEGPHGVEAVYVLAGDAKTPEGYHAVGYVARGAQGGPLVVGEFRYLKGGGFDLHTGDDDNHDDLDRLLDLNAKKAPDTEKAASAKADADAKDEG